MNRTAIVVPVRLALGGRVLQSTSRSLDGEGLFVRCVAPPLPGMQVSVRLYLPDGKPEDVECVVVPERELREVGCRVKFLSLTEAQRARLLRVISPPTLQPLAGRSPGQPAARPVPLPGASPQRSPIARIELRALVRVPVQLKVRFESVDALVEQLALDLSAGGMFVRSDDPPRTGEEVQLLFALPDDEEHPLSCRALVVRRITPEEARFTGRVAGVGVQFVDASDSFRARLDDWLARAQGLTPLDE